METSTPAEVEQNEREKLKAIRVGSSLLLHPLPKPIQNGT
jgi:virulence-associated protein VagC